MINDFQDKLKMGHKPFTELTGCTEKKITMSVGNMQWTSMNPGAKNGAQRKRHKEN